jgi:murein DD-endopeptidase MepM/ murein hydrolase activator NlpD
MKRKTISVRKLLLLALTTVLLVPFLIPQKLLMPVKGANSGSYHPGSFWYYPWGKSVTHKGVDIFAAEGTPVASSTAGLVVFRGEIGMGGNVVLVLGPKWRLHYYAHLKEIKASRLQLLSPGETIGSVGSTGNARGRPPHLHYSIITLLPYPWRMDNSRQGWKKMFYLNPIDYMKKAH